MQMGAVLSALLVILLGTRQLPQELEARTIHPILAKPVRRSAVIQGKALPVWLLGIIAMMLFAGLTLLITPHLPFQQRVMLAQALLVYAISMAMLTGLIIWLSLLMPPAVAMLAGGGVFFAGNTATNMFVHYLGLGAWLRPITGLMPDFSLLDCFQRFVDGGPPLSMPELFKLAAYGMLWSFLFYGLALLKFKKMAI
jgi:ABC-type transport system involved in multi-copper enzyme maturation permease subunit